MAPVLFLVHGMGDNSPGWSAEVKQKLDDVSARYSSVAAFANRKPFTQVVTCVEVTYDDVFTKYLAQFGGTIEGVRDVAAKRGIQLPGLFEWLTAHATPREQAFFWSHFVDVVLYALFREIRTDVQVRVMDSIAQVAQHGGDFSVMSHSLGTAVAHDSLARLGSEPWQGGKGFSATGSFRFRNFFTLANVSRFVQLVTGGDVYGSCVRPASAGSPGYCERFFQFFHRYDPFTAAHAFTPQGWGTGYRYVGPLDHFARLNVHSWTHYLDHPAVHVALINQLYGDFVVDDRQLAAAVADYHPRPAAECAARLEEIKSLLGFAQHQLLVSPDVQTFALLGSKLYAKMREAGNACF
jgi:hypothetical protein